MTDSDRIKWLVANCNYFEHGGKDNRDGFWPHEDDGTSTLHFNPNYLEMTLVEYIDTRISEEQKQSEEEYHRQAADRIDQLIEARLYREVE